VDRGRQLGLRLLGLMTLAPLVAEEAQAEAAQRVFEGLAQLARGLPGQAFETGRPQLSMGMSADLEQAVACGSDVVRVGTALFRGLGGQAA
jgi:uncharacterized pyridoxal phosphate-containing UPF0001 family protein